MPQKKRSSPPSPWPGVGTVEPGDSALDDPAAGQDNKAPGIGTPDDLDGKAIEMGDYGFQLRSCIAAIGKEAAKGGYASRHC